MGENTLKPCPFCGGSIRIEEDLDGDRVIVLCSSSHLDCVISQSPCVTATPEQWNTRPTESDLQSKLDAVVEALEKVLRTVDCYKMTWCPHHDEPGGCGGADIDCDWLISARAAIQQAKG
jgi:hypothetical protein